MFLLEKTVNICAGHHLRNYSGKCATPHGHNYKITVRCEAPDNGLDAIGFVIDFGDIKQVVKRFDHVDLNTLPEFDEKSGVNPTAENMARVIYGLISFCYEVEIEETPGSIIKYRED